MFETMVCTCPKHTPYKDTLQKYIFFSYLWQPLKQLKNMNASATNYLKPS